MLAIVNVSVRKVDAPTVSMDFALTRLSKFISPKVVVDVGVAQGTPELYRTFPDVSYVLVEADPSFKESIAELGETLDAQVHHAFAGKEKGEVALHIYEDARKSSAFASRVEGRKVKGTVTVPVLPLDAIVEGKESLLLKIDVEGAELDVLAGASRVLSHAEAVIIEAALGSREGSQSSFDSIVHFMHEHNFSVFDIVAGANREGKLAQVDLIFVPTDAPYRVRV